MAESKIVLHPVNQLETIHTRHQHVTQNQVESDILPQQIQRFIAITRHFDPEIVGQLLPQAVSHIGVVFHHQNMIIVGRGQHFIHYRRIHFHVMITQIETVSLFQYIFVGIMGYGLIKPDAEQGIFSGLALYTNFTVMQIDVFFRKIKSDAETCRTECFITGIKPLEEMLHALF